MVGGSNYLSFIMGTLLMANISTQGICAAPTDTLSWGNDTTRVTVTKSPDNGRIFSLETSHKLRDDLEGSRVVVESPTELRLFSGHDMFDAMFAMALEELKQDSVDQIVDEAFNHGQPIDCHSFVAGEKWPYTWTRDTAYAIDLSLGLLDPIRARDALLFKVSARRAGKGADSDSSFEIAQDTGSGGSWPISADRVVWALAADQLMPYLDQDARVEFRSLAFSAVSHTLENDRIAIYDPHDGLYRGEQSFLDWREQTYPTWTKLEVLAIGKAKALSTNVLQFIALKAAARWAGELHNSEAQQKYDSWAIQLKSAINKKFWTPARGLYGSQAELTAGVGPLEKFDMLGEALAVLSGVADQAKASAIFQSYPHTLHGPPVIWPSSKALPIYHNRAVWPFVTAYAIRGAIRASHAAAITHNVRAVFRQAALNLSNMENYEFLSGEPYVSDGSLSGPVVNSRRQLWSVAGYLSTVLDVVFGVKATEQGISFQPAITRRLHGELFATRREVMLKNLPYQGHYFDLHVSLPEISGEAENDGIYEIDETRLNGKRLPSTDSIITPTALKDGVNSVEIRLTSRVAASPPLHLVENASVAYAPSEPRLHYVRQTKGDGPVELVWDTNGEKDVGINIYRNGRKVADQVLGGSWLDTDEINKDLVRCYAITQIYLNSQNESHPAAGVCIGRENDAKEISVLEPAWQSLDGAAKTDEYGRYHYRFWGRNDQRLQLAFEVLSTGNYDISLIYGNAFGPVITGVTAAVKYAVVVDTVSNEVVGSGVFVMPHLPSWQIWRDSSPLKVVLSADRHYELRVSDYFNMSYLSHFALYTGGVGGNSGPLNCANIAGALIRPSSL